MSYKKECIIFMKKKLLTSILLSTVILSQGAALVSVKAETTDEKIAAQDSKINSLTEQQQSAQAQVNEIQGQVSAIQKQQEELKAENEKLSAESARLSAEIDELSKNIVARNESLANQARSTQTNGTATSYINTVVNSSSITEAISRVAAMSEIVSANNKMLEQQKKDKEVIAEKQVANNEAINTVIANQEKLADDEQALAKTAQASLAAEKATAENEKNSLLEEKAAAEKAAAEAAAREAAYKAEQESKRQAIEASGNTTLQAQVQAVVNSAPAAEAAAPAAPAVTQSVARANRPVYSSSASSYPVGQCTWGAKTLAPWAGDYWGNGGQWSASAAAAGFRVGSQPEVGAIACWTDGGYGHVAVVTAVQSTTSIQVSEANYLGQQSIGNYRGWFNPTTAQGTVSYIYPN